MLQLGRQRADAGEISKAFLKEELAQDSPVVGVVPDHLDRHDFGIAEQRVLILIKRKRAFVEGTIELLIDARPAADMLAVQIAFDHIDDVRVADRDEIAARRIERIEEHTCFAGERPAISA